MKEKVEDKRLMYIMCTYIFCAYRRKRITEQFLETEHMTSLLKKTNPKSKKYYEVLRQTADEHT